MHPLALTDSQLGILYRSAAPLAPAIRPAFLLLVAQRLAGQELGDAVVARCCAEAQGCLWVPPGDGQFAHHEGQNAPHEGQNASCDG